METPIFGPDSWAYGVLAVILVQASICDVRTGMIYNRITYPAIFIGLASHWLAGGWAGEHVPGGTCTMGLLDAMVGFAAGFLPLFVVWLAGGIGGGDAKIMGAVGALTGWRFALTAMFYGFAVAVLMAVVIMLRRRIAMKTLGRIWQFLWLSVLRAKPGAPDGPDSVKLPFGLALCIGTVGVMVAVVVMRYYGVEGPMERLFFLSF